MSKFIPIQKSIAEVDSKIEALGNRRAEAHPCHHARADAMIRVLGDRLTPYDIHQRWGSEPSVESGALSARAWLIGDLDELSLF